MNNWNYNEVTQADLYEFKACKHNVTGQIYGIKDSSTCQSGKEISKEDIEKLAIAANKGDKKAKAELNKINKAKDDQKAKERKEKEAAKKKKEEEGKKGKKGKGKKGGGKGKKAGGKGKKGGGAAKKGKGGAAAKKGGGGRAQPAAKANAAKSNQARQKARKEALTRARDTVKRLQKMMREVTDPKARQQIQKAIGDLMKSVVDATKADIGQGQTSWRGLGRWSSQRTNSK